MLSILLPSYNNICLPLVKELQRQASLIEALQYEIIVADDGGTDFYVKQQNTSINDIPYCRYIIREENVGRAAIRNFLASQAQYDWLLFLDSDVSMVRKDFLAQYISVIHSFPSSDVTVIDGGITVCGNQELLRHNLRFWYEYKSQAVHTADKRKLKPHKNIHTANLLVPRKVMMQHGFDERFVRYGYEDVLFGKRLKERNIKVMHVDNPVGLDKFETNISFIHKTEEALQTLHDFSLELEGYNGILDITNRLRRWHLLWIVRLWHSIFYPIEKLNLVSSHPSLTIFNIYKLGYYASI